MPGEGLVNVDQDSGERTHSGVIEEVRRNHKQQRAGIGRRSVLDPAIGQIAGGVDIFGDLLRCDSDGVGTVSCADDCFKTHAQRG